jgi:peptidoglycan/LPS O-acetylase OafA/YrhL
MESSVTSENRIFNLDVLRAIAVLLVMMKHIFHLELTATDFEWLSPIRPLMRAGWIGVPIFFALSGYLIGRLLFVEYGARGSLNLGRFWVRRGFKIYPTFYVVIFAYAAYLFFIERHLDWERLLCEVLFIQNYGKGGLFEVTWSLAVEEHFYIVFPILLLILIRVFESKRGGRVVEPGERLNAFKPIIAISLILTGACLWFRLNGAADPTTKLRAFSWTHWRIDALFAGASVAFVHLKYGNGMCAFFRRYSGLFLFIALAFTYPAFLPEDTYGLAFYRAWFPLILSVSSVLILGTALAFPGVDMGAVKSMAKLGKYSYGIYLCHVPLFRLMNKIAHFLPQKPHVYLWVSASFVVAIVGGIVVTKMIELPFLQLRDRWFPRVQQSQAKESQLMEPVAS